MSRSHDMLEWVTSTMLLKRWQFIAISLGLGLVFAGIIYVGRQEAEHARESRDRLARDDRRQQKQIVDAARDRRRLALAIRQLQRLRHPTPADIRREVDRLIGALRHLTPVQAQRLRAVLLNVQGGAPTKGGSGQAPGGSSTSPPSRGSPGSGSSPPPGRGQPPGGSPAPPFRSPPTPPGIDLPPIDPDGPGPLPTIDPPPIRLPSLPLPIR